MSGSSWAGLWLPLVMVSLTNFSLLVVLSLDRGYEAPLVSCVRRWGQLGWWRRRGSSWSTGRNSEPYPAAVCAWALRAVARSKLYFSRTEALWVAVAGSIP